MRKLLILISLLSLLLTLTPSFLVFFGVITLELNKTLMLIGTIGWFATAPYWMNKKSSKEETL